jgi:hypothetical protein
MPQHDPPVGPEPGSNVIDFRAHLRHRVTDSGQDNGDAGPGSPDRPDSPDWDMFRHAEYGDGKRPAFSRYDLLWIGMILVIGWIFWKMFRG